MEKLRKAVNQIAYAQDLHKLPPYQRSLVPILSFVSAFYKLAFSLRHHFYRTGVFHKHRLPMPVISVGNLTWGGNGKTPMVEFIAKWFTDSGISPLILTRGYGGGDEANMLQRHLARTSTKIGVGANRVTTASTFLQRYGYVDPHNDTCFERLSNDKKVSSGLDSEKIGAGILDDGMQALEEKLKDIELTVREAKEALPIFFTGMVPSYFFEVGNIYSRVPLTAVNGAITLCVSALGFANAFVQGIKKTGPCYVDRLDFSDHHIFQSKDIEMIRTRLIELQHKFDTKPVVVVTEKDYDRDPEILKQLNPYQVLVLCSQLQIIPRKGCTEESFKKLLKQLLQRKYQL